jgi:hypothetical protein
LRPRPQTRVPHSSPSQSRPRRSESEGGGVGPLGAIPLSGNAARRRRPTGRCSPLRAPAVAAPSVPRPSQPPPCPGGAAASFRVWLRSVRASSSASASHPPASATHSSIAILFTLPSPSVPRPTPTHALPQSPARAPRRALSAAAPPPPRRLSGRCRRRAGRWPGHVMRRGDRAATRGRGGVWVVCLMSSAPAASATKSSLLPPPPSPPWPPPSGPSAARCWPDPEIGAACAGGRALAGGGMQSASRSSRMHAVVGRCRAAGSWLLRTIPVRGRAGKGRAQRWQGCSLGRIHLQGPAGPQTAERV